MTLHVYPDITQGTEEWDDLRRGMVTASAVGKLITPKTVAPASNPESRGLQAVLAAERITGYTEPTYVSDDMWRGREDEPIARQLYADHFGVEVKQMGFMCRDDSGHPIGYSPDGLVGDDGCIEIKSRRQHVHLKTILDDHPPIENMAQMQCALLVSGREWCDYISFSGGMPFWTKRVFPQQKWFDAILKAVELFENNVAEMIRLYQDSVIGLPETERNPLITGELKLA